MTEATSTETRFPPSSPDCSGAGLRDATNFVAFDEPGFAKAAINFRVTDREDGTTLITTETRIRCTDPGSRRRFRLYWLFVLPGSALIRRVWLRAIRRRAEAASRAVSAQS